MSEDALGHRRSVNVLDTVHGGAAGPGERGDKVELLASALFQGGSQLRTHIAPQGRIRLFIEAGHLQRRRLPDDAANDVRRLFRRQMAGFRIHHQHLHRRVHLFQGIAGVQQHSGGGMACHELHARIQRAGQIIRQNQ